MQLLELKVTAEETLAAWRRGGTVSYAKHLATFSAITSFCSNAGEANSKLHSTGEICSCEPTQNERCGLNVIFTDARGANLHTDIVFVYISTTIH